MSWYMVAYLWTLTFLDTAGITPRGLKVFGVALVIGVVIGMVI